MASTTTRARPRLGMIGSALVTTLAVAALALLGTRMLHASPPADIQTEQTSVPGLIWSEEFNGPAEQGVDRSRWRVAEGAGGWGNNELQNYTDKPANLALDGEGHLAITAQRQRTTDKQGREWPYTSARISSIPTAPNGRIEARINVPAGAGLWSAFWTLGKNHGKVGWPTSGEIDVMETMNDTAEVNANAHAASVDAGGQFIGRWQKLQATRPANPVGGSWHTYTLERKNDELRFLLDGVEFHRIRADELTDGQQWPFNQPQQVLLNLAVGGDWPGAPNTSTPFPATMLVDYVRVYDTSVLDW